MARRAASSLLLAAAVLPRAPLGRRTPHAADSAAIEGDGVDWWQDVPQVRFDDIDASRLRTLLRHSGGDACPRRGGADDGRRRGVLALNVSAAGGGDLDVGVLRCNGRGRGDCAAAPAETAWLAERLSAIRRRGGRDLDGAMLCSMMVRTHAALKRHRASQPPIGSSSLLAVGGDDDVPEVGAVGVADEAKQVEMADLEDGGSSSSSLSSDSNACAICLDQLEDPVGLRCNHHFCRQCIEGWLERSEECPLCRLSVRTPMEKVYDRISNPRVANRIVLGLGATSGAVTLLALFPNESAAIVVSIYLLFASISLLCGALSLACES